MLPPETSDEIVSYISFNTPKWIGDAEVFARFNYLKDTIEFSVYFTPVRMDWVKIQRRDTNDGEIDQWCNLRADYNLPLEDFSKMTLEEVCEDLWSSVYAFWAEIVLCPAQNDSSDPIYHVADRANFLPRDEVRKMILTDISRYAPRINKYSSFREEDWYKEWQESQLKSD